ncbi:MAG: hypothetical protein V9G22_15010 [Ottowia sp.]
MNTATNTAPLMPTSEPGTQPYEVVRFNALKHGILSRYTVLSHESHADYESLVNSLMDEHLPAGATEQHLIEELASVIWRKRRVLQAEGATINKGLKESARSAKTVIPAAAPFEMGLSGENTDIREPDGPETGGCGREPAIRPARHRCHQQGQCHPAQRRRPRL